MQHLIIGDIHGCFDELQDLLQAAGLAPDDRIIALGDIVDRGPDSPQVLDFFDSAHNAMSLMGNHERKHVHSHAGRIRPALSQQITRRQIGEASSDRLWVADAERDLRITHSQIGEAAYDAACRIMDRFPRYIELPEAILVHGFYEPGVPLAEQRETVVVGTLSGEHHLQQQDRRPWYQRYDGAKPLVVGHHDYLRTGQPLIWDDRVWAIDTGCCHGGRLTGLLLPGFRIVSVPSRRDYWTELQEQHADLRYGSTPVEQLNWEAADRIARRLDAVSNLPPEQREHASLVADRLRDGERAVAELYRLISGRHQEILHQIAAEIDLDELTARELGRRYAAQLGNSPLAAYLHRMRQGRLSLEDLKQSFGGPTEAEACLKKSWINS